MRELVPTESGSGLDIAQDVDVDGPLHTVDNGGKKKMTVTRFELARETHHGLKDGPKRDAVTTWLHCRVEGANGGQWKGGVFLYWEETYRRL